LFKNQSLFVDAVKRFNASVVVAILLTPHASDYGINLKLLLVIVGGILAPPVGMMQHLSVGLLAAVCLL